jgi:signal transduction histidine kinase
VLVAGMLAIGIWVTEQIEDGVTRNSAAATALYVDSVIAPLLPEIRGEQALPDVTRRALDEVLAQGALGERLSSFKIWQQGGRIAYASEASLIGQTFEPTENLEAAWAGRVAAEFDSLDDAENELERRSERPLLEIYSPIREPWSGEVVAVVEFYEAAEALQQDLFDARLRSWLVVAAVTVGMLGLLFGIVRRGSRMIERQRAELQAQVSELSRLLTANDDLRRRVQRASGRAAALNERFLRKVSADLHDGPAQLLALASLRLGNAGQGKSEAGETAAIRRCLDEAMREIRDICRGLTLPHLERMDLPELIRSAVAAHEERTGSTVALSLSGAPPQLSQSEKICVYRFVQEGLANAFRHAGGKAQAVSAGAHEDALSVVVSDEGGGFAAGDRAREGLGLAGLRERIESLGGAFSIESKSDGTRVAMTLRTEGTEAR